MDRTLVVRRGLPLGTAAVLALLSLLLLALPAAAAPPPVPQTPLDPRTIPQFVDPLPTITDMGGPLIAGFSPLELTMREFQSRVLPSTMVLPTGQPYTGTWVWGYRTPGDAATRTSYLGPLIIATRGQPTTMRYVNELGTVDETNVLAYKNSVDQTLHWADPLGGEANMGNMDIVPMMPPMPPFDQLYRGPIAATVHLHGGEVPPQVDGGPDSWFLSQEPTAEEQAANPDWTMHGSGYYSDPGHPDTPANGATYTYPNTQEAAPIWFHDHTLGATRLNVYAGLAGAYVLTDPDLQLPAGLSATGLSRSNPTGDETITPLVIQDRMFDTDGQLYFPAVGINAEHPYWVPEFIGDTIVVNGKAWPFLNVKAQRYRFLFLNGSNARTYEMSFAVSTGTGTAPAFWQIGTDGGYLDRPARLNKLVIMPGERADVIVDFRGVAPGSRLLLKNTAKTPYPNGGAPLGRTTGRIMQFRVTGGAAVPDTSFNPAAAGATIKGAPGQAPATVRLTDPATGTLAPGITVDTKRALTLNEVMGMPMPPYPGGPLEVLVNNTKWSGESPRPYDDFREVARDDGPSRWYSEMPAEGSTEVWEFINLTADAHPMHLHLVQFQLISRQRFDVGNYTLAYDAAFPGADMGNHGLFPAGAYIPGFGPPLDYNVPNAAGAVGGNPDVTPFLTGPIRRPAANETGWKDTILVPPGQVTRIAVRWAPTDLPATTPAADAFFPFDPSGNDGLYGYVWHCHIVDHEDNEMMRPDLVIANPNAERTVPLP
jgi:FtsP/CotA-like multicopper oxidase with cupredoxin domain